MPHLIDGDNLLGTWPGRSRTDEERRALAFELARFASRGGRRVVVVFDGNPPPGQAPAGLGSDVLFSGPGRTADDVILAFLGEQSAPGEWIVVTSDRPLADRSRWIGARHERCDRFRRRLGPGAAGEKPERESDIDYWLEQFGGDD